MSRWKMNHSKQEQHWTIIARKAAESKECERSSDSKWYNETTRLTPRHLLRQWLPSWLRRGQTTSLLTSATEKEVWRGARGGIAQRRGRGRAAVGGAVVTSTASSKQASKQ